MQSIMVSTLTPVVRMEEGCSGGSLVKNFILHIFVRSGILGFSIASASGAALGCIGVGRGSRRRQIFGFSVRLRLELDKVGDEREPPSPRPMSGDPENDGERMSGGGVDTVL